MANKYTHLKFWSNEYIAEVDTDDNGNLSAVKFMEYCRCLKVKVKEEWNKAKKEVQNKIGAEEQRRVQQVQQRVEEAQQRMEEAQQRVEDEKHKAEMKAQWKTEKEKQRQKAEKRYTETVWKEAEELAQKRVSGDLTALTIYWPQQIEQVQVEQRSKRKGKEFMCVRYTRTGTESVPGEG